MPRWKFIELVLTAWYDLRTFMHAILYVVRTGVPWRHLPHDYSPWQAACGDFRTRRETGISSAVRFATGQCRSHGGCALAAGPTSHFGRQAPLQPLLQD